MNDKELEKIEIELLLDGIMKRYGYNFHHYASASLKRRLQQALIKTKSHNYIELLDKILANPSEFQKLLMILSVTVTEMFRDPFIYETIRNQIIPVLKTYPYIKIWHAGCATGEEVYSMAIMLHETGLLEKTQLYATDINTQALVTAKEGVYPIEQIKKYNKNYQLAGGNTSLTDYYKVDAHSVIMADFLKRKMTFAYHNLAVDGSFCEAQMIMCRNVLIYFDRELQTRVLNLFNESLSFGGFLFLGTKETLKFSSLYNQYNCLVPEQKLYQKYYPEERHE